MTKQAFIRSVEEEFEQLSAGDLNEDSVIKDINGWDSMHALILTAKIDSEWDVTITADDLSKIKTIGDLYTLVQSRI